MKPSGTHLVSKNVWGDLLDQRFPSEAFVLVDAKVKKLHPSVKCVCEALPHLELVASEKLKSLSSLEKVAQRTRHLSRNATVIAIGGGTVGDFATVFAHLHKRGIKLIHVPSTLLAAVDSSVGGKGALNVGGTKNSLGVFHGAEQTFLFPHLWSTLSEAQLREGRIEAFKTALNDAKTFARWTKKLPDDIQLVKEARALKAKIVQSDAFELNGKRAVLNFGHTFGHLIETVSKFKISHGEAVGLGMLCALDVGVELGVTSTKLATKVEQHIPQLPDARKRLEKNLKSVNETKLKIILRADKKGSTLLTVKMMLLKSPGHIIPMDVPFVTLTQLLAQWKKGIR
jgi:3-dehydroquinate synthase